MVDLVRQGMIFFIEDLTSNQNVLFKGEHTPLKRRPWVVVSNNKHNRHASEVSMCPIYTRHSTTIPTQVYYKGSDGRDQVICCEDVRPIPIRYIDQRGYVGTISSDIMIQVRQALAVQFSDCDPDIKPSTTNIIKETVTDILNTMDIKSIIAQKVCEVLFQGINSTSNDVITKEPVTELTPVTNAIPKTEEPKSTPISKPTTRITSDTNVKETVPKKKVHKPHGKPIPKDRLREFYNDSNNMSVDELYDKWNAYGVIKDHSFICKKRHAIKLRLESLGM